ncbi:hypothetical protein AWV79_22080 [Cupriavidus sp. UYMMa02A]|nr:hypothetical protein AWV79_22080 [Cupriavidus sp. UYMMa02A]
MTAAVVVFGRLAGDPADEVDHGRVAPQRFPVVEAACQFGFGEDRMDLLVADAVHRHGLAATVAARNRVVQVRARALDELPATERAAPRASLRIGGGRPELVVPAGPETAFDDHVARPVSGVGTDIRAGQARVRMARFAITSSPPCPHNPH